MHFCFVIAPIPFQTEDAKKAKMNPKIKELRIKQRYGFQQEVMQFIRE